ncbi:PE family protein [Mycobacterium intracellulare]|uniref:PE family protein n=1 Tax=Mycobacterium intracellulare subsp. chimaera TaxID=222805 RepID=A0A1Y0T3J1_MYCIT|nr:PE family protein [Mycobacterium intracellulare]APD84046.1 PE family protein [Mycobacterium intracellulare subsp. chimaera]ARV81696.1 PE family protein [Mycobacterium intracellulare subsp. chimaera]ASL08792.1 PE family protein [Mycobacterium intracellulare subsp. chimaera]ASL14445.1 PE family protein [Mycobacterium intracellulare subsp. chimaera]ASL20574.1 PE family protein [Mycobacterium intracellulare subsp. chimaera]
MSFVTTQPEMLTSAAGDMHGNGSEMAAKNNAAAGPATGVGPAAIDEMSTLTAVQLVTHAQTYQVVAAQVMPIHDDLMTTLAAGAGSYAATEAANASG